MVEPSQFIPQLESFETASVVSLSLISHLMGSESSIDSEREYRTPLRSERDTVHYIPVYTKTYIKYNILSAIFRRFW